MKNFNRLRKKIDNINKDIIKLLKKRKITVLKLSYIKKKNNIEAIDTKRENEIYKKIKNESIAQDLDPIYTNKIFKIIFNFSRNIQKEKI